MTLTRAQCPQTATITKSDYNSTQFITNKKHQDLTPIPKFQSSDPLCQITYQMSINPPSAFITFDSNSRVITIDTETPQQQQSLLKNKEYTINITQRTMRCASQPKPSPKSAPATMSPG